MSKNNIVWAIFGLWLIFLTVRSFRSEGFRSDGIDEYSDGISLGYQDAVNDFRNGKLIIADDQIRIRVERYGNEDSVYFLVFKNPNFFIKSVEETVENQ